MIQDPCGRGLSRRTLDACALDDRAHHREVLVTPAAKSDPAASRDICFRRELIACQIQVAVRGAALEIGFATPR
jgi:hypothetical protein